MRLEQLIGIPILVVVILIIGRFIFKRIPRKLKNSYFTTKWRELQSYCSDPETWAWAVTEADKLLNEALKKRRFKGKRMGERLVAAQRKLSDNDAVWYAHNLRKKIAEDDSFHLRKNDVKKALIGFRQALKDLGAFKDRDQNDEKNPL